jgi:hypothetical protein
VALIHHWKLDETSGLLYDSVGTAHGTATGTTSVPGLFANARNFAGGTDKIDCGGPSDLEFGSNPWTLRALIKSTSTSTQRIATRDSATVRSYNLGTALTTGYLRAFVTISSTVYIIDSTSSVCDGLIHDVIVRRNGTVLSIFVDGVFSGSVAIPAGAIDNPTLPATPFIIGSDAWGGSGWTGLIDNVQVWDHALTDAEVADHYYKGLSSSSLVDQDPAPNEVNVAIDKSPILSIQDNVNNIVLSKIYIEVHGYFAYDGVTDTFQSGFTGTRTGNSSKYTFTINPNINFDHLDTIPIHVYAENDDSQILDKIYQFVTKEYSYEDKSPNAHLLCVGDNQIIHNIGLLFPSDNLTSYIENVQPSNSQLTIEAKFKPHLNSNESYLLNSAELNCIYNNRGLVYWSYVASGQTHYYIHQKLLGLRSDEINYIGIRHIFGDKTSTGIVINGIKINGKWHSTIPAQTSGSGLITAFSDIGGGIIRVTSAGHGISNDTWVRIYGTTNYNNLFKISNVFANTFDITAIWAGDDGTGTWDKTNNDHNMAGYGMPNFSNLTYYCSLGINDILMQISMTNVAKTIASLIEIAKGRM